MLMAYRMKTAMQHGKEQVLRVEKTLTSSPTLERTLQVGHHTRPPRNIRCILRDHHYLEETPGTRGCTALPASSCNRFSALSFVHPPRPTILCHNCRTKRLLVPINGQAIIFHHRQCGANHSHGRKRCGGELRCSRTTSGNWRHLGYY